MSDAPVNRLTFKIEEGRTLGRDLLLLINRRSLLELLEEAVPNSSERTGWTEKRDAKVRTKELRRSSESAGEFEILTCAHCGFVEDLCCSPFRVSHVGEFVDWAIDPPGAGIFFQDYDPVRFRLHRPDYEQAVKRILQREP
jgi:hypothetical protein